MSAIKDKRSRIKQLRKDIQMIGQIYPLSPKPLVPKQSSPKSPSLDNLHLNTHQHETLQDDVAYILTIKQEKLQSLRSKLDHIGNNVKDKIKQKEEIQRLLENGLSDIKEAKKNSKNELRSLNDASDSVQIEREKDIQIYGAEKHELREKIKKFNG